MTRQSRHKSKNKGVAKPGKEIIQRAVEEAKEVLKEYQDEKKASQQNMSGGANKKGGGARGGGDNSFGNLLGGQPESKRNLMAEFLGSIGGSSLVMGAGLLAGILQGMNESAENFDFANRYGIVNTPKNLNSKEEDIYRNALINAFGYTGFQVNGWKNWMSAEEYIEQGGFQNGDRGGSILGLLQDGEYYKVG